MYFEGSIPYWMANRCENELRKNFIVEKNYFDVKFENVKLLMR